MALATSHLDAVTGLAAGLDVDGRASRLGVRSGGGELLHVTVPATPDRRAADHVTAGYRHLVWQRIDVSDGRIECRLRGVRHRLPSERPISLAAALALVERGLPTVVRVEAH